MGKLLNMIEHDKPWDCHGLFPTFSISFRPRRAFRVRFACAEPKTKAPVVAHSKADVSFHANQLSTINSVLWKDLPGGYVTMTYHDIS